MSAGAGGTIDGGRMSPMRRALVAGAVVTAIVAAGVVSVALPDEDPREFRAVAEAATRLSSANTTTTATSTTRATTTVSTASTTTMTAPPPTTAPTTEPPTTAAPQGPPSDPEAPSPEECQAFLDEVLAASRAPTSGETQYLWMLCGISIDDYYP